MNKQILTIYLLLHGALIICMETTNHMSALPPEIISCIMPFLNKQDRQALKCSCHLLNEKILSHQQLNQRLANAAYSQNISGIQTWLMQGADDLNTALVHAASSEHNDVAINLLVMHEASLNMALQQAAYLDNIFAIEQLIKHGARDFEWALYRALAGGHIRTYYYMFLAQHTPANCNNCLFWAACSGNFEIVEYMLQLFCNPRYGTYGNVNWALYGASMSGHHELITLLIEKYHANDIQKSIESAIEGNQTDTVNFLKQYQGTHDD